MKFNVHDQVLVCDKDSEFFSRMGMVYEIKDGLYGVELAGPRPLGFLWFFEPFLIPFTVKDHKRLMLESSNPNYVAMANSMKDM